MVKTTIATDATRIRIPTFVFVGTEPRREAEILSALNTCSKDHRLLVWDLADTNSTATKWALNLRKRISTQVSNGRLANVSRLVIVGAPHDWNQARLISDFCPKAKVIYVGPDIRNPNPDVHRRSVINAVKDMKERGHECEFLDPNTVVEKIIQYALVNPAHHDAGTDQLVSEYRLLPQAVRRDQAPPVFATA